jgi:hypothetical protein
MKRLIPFTNGTEAMIWLERNCEKCITKCHFKRNIEDGFVTGDITIKTAEFIGYDKMNGKYVYLAKCQHKNEYKPKRKQLDLKTNPTLF